MKGSITSMIDGNRNIKYDYGGKRNFITKEMDVDIKDAHKKIFDKYQEIKRLTTKVS